MMIEPRRALVASLAALVMACALAGIELRVRSLRAARDAEQPIVQRAASAVGGELALHAGARWLRHPTRSEPWAYGHDGPGVADPDPAGAFASAPRATLLVGGAVTRARLRANSLEISR